MDINAFAAAKNYAALRPATEPVAGSGAGIGQTLGALAQDFAQTFQQGEDTAKAAMVGQADPHSLVQALSQAELAVEAAVTVRDKVVEAYQEILRMPV